MIYKNQSGEGVVVGFYLCLVVCCRGFFFFFSLLRLEVLWQGCMQPIEMKILCFKWDINFKLLGFTKGQ